MTYIAMIIISLSIYKCLECEKLKRKNEQYRDYIDFFREELFKEKKKKVKKLPNNA